MEERRSAVGLARPLPAMSGADPWTASKIDASCGRRYQPQFIESPQHRTYSANVAGRSQSETSDQTSAHVGKDVTVQVGHDHDTVSVGGGVLSDLSRNKLAGVVLAMNLHTWRQTRSRRSSSYAMFGYSFAT